MTKTVIISKTGGPEVLELKDFKIKSPGPSEVLIEHKAIGLNFIDIYHRSGLYPIDTPSGIGAEAAGVIKEVGDKIHDFKVGDRIAYAGLPLGAYSSHRVFPTKDIVKVPETINLEVAATLMTKGLTAYYLLHKTYPVSKGETILFHAAAGALGQIFCQCAKSLGCIIIGTVGSNEKVDIARSNGCDYVINYTKEDFAEKVLSITHGKGVSVVYDGVGHDTLDGSIKSLKVRGTMVSFGNASGALPEVSVPKLIQPKGLYLTRPAMHLYLGTRDELLTGAKVLFEKIENGSVKIEIFKRYKLDDVITAHQDLENRKILGPAVIIPN